MTRIRDARRPLFASIALAAAIAVAAAGSLLGNCGPFTDVANDSFCAFVLEIFYLGITTGTTPTTYDPASNVSRLQMAAFLSRTVDGVLKRGSRRAILDQFWTSQNSTVLGVTTVGNNPTAVKADGADLWVANFSSASVSRVRASDGALVETWTGATAPTSVLVAMGRVLVTGKQIPGALYQINPSQAAGAVTTVASSLGQQPVGIAFDGAKVWTANAIDHSVSIVTPGASIPWSVTTVTTGFSGPTGMVFDGSSVWVTDNTAHKVFKLDGAGAILATVTVGNGPEYPGFDGTNVWVPSDNSTLAVVRPSSGAVLATLTGNGMNAPFATAFDGQRILVTNQLGNSVSLWKAADLSPLGSFSTGAATFPTGAASDGIHFWITLQTSPGKLARF